jgi:hypothetical protein
MQDHVKIIGILWIVFGALSLFGALVIFLILMGASLIPDMGTIAPGILRFVGFVASSFLALLGVPKIVGGIGLLKGHEWARILVLVVSFLSLINIPFGTALGVYSIVVLFDKETVKAFQTRPPAVK